MESVKTGAVLLLVALWAASAMASDLDADGDADVVLRSETNGVWHQFRIQNRQVVSNSRIQLFTSGLWIHQTLADLDADGDADFVLRKASGEWWRFEVDGGNIASRTQLRMFANQEWQFAAALDADADGDKDLLLRHAHSGAWRLFYMQAGNVAGSYSPPLFRNTLWQIAGVGDLNGDGDEEVILRRTDNGRWRTFEFQSGTVARSYHVRRLVQASAWHLVAIGNTNSTAAMELLLRNSITGEWRIAQLTDYQNAVLDRFNTITSLDWQVVQTADYDADGDVDLLMRHRTTGLWRILAISNARVVANDVVAIYSSSNLAIQGFVPTCADPRGGCEYTDQPADDLGQPHEVAVSCLSTSADAGTLLPDPSLDGNWTQFRRDRRLTGRSPLIGNVTCPELLWVYDLAARKTWFDVSLTPSDGNIEVPISANVGNEWQARQDYRVERMLVDLDGDGNERVDETEQGRVKVADIRPDLDGYERVTCVPDAIDPNAFSQTNNDPLPCALQNRTNGAWETVWQTVPLRGFTASTTTSGEPVIADVDDDGELEAVVLGWSEVYVLNLTTGAVEQTGVFLDESVDNGDTTPRAYGWMGAFNLDDDPRLEIVILGDFEMHVTVIGWQGSSFVELWDHQIQAGTFRNTAVHHTGTNPVADLDGDGKPEIATSIYNQSGDERWHAVVFNGETGAIKADFPDRYISGIANIDATGASELLLSERLGNRGPGFGTVEAVQWVSGTPTVIWQQANADFQTLDTEPFPLNVNSAASLNRRTAFRYQPNGQPPIFALTTQAPGQLQFLQYNSGSIEQLGSLTGANLTLRASPPDDTLNFLVQAITAADDERTIGYTNLTPRLVSSGRTDIGDGDPAAFGNLLTSTVVAPMSPNAAPTIVTQDGQKHILALGVNPDGSVDPRWRISGRGPTDGDYSRLVTSVNGFGSVLFADLYGDYGLELLVADRADDGSAVLKAIGENGAELWRHTAVVPGDPPVWNIGGITTWFAGHFTRTSGEDIALSYRLAKSASDHMLMLDGRTGAQQWIIDNGGQYSACGNVLGAGGATMPVFDWDQDGLDDLLNLQSSIYAVYDGLDGSILHNRWMTDWCGPSSQQIFPTHMLAGAIAPIADYNGDNEEEVLYAKSLSTLALLNPNGDPVWNTTFFDGMPTQSLQGIGDLSGNGELDIVTAGYCGDNGEEVQKHDGATGVLEWSLDLPRACEWPSPKALATGDLDGDGKDEALVMNGNVLYAIGENSAGAGAVLWTVRFAGADWWGEYGDPVIADIDGSGRPRILINSPHGYLFAIGNP